MGGYLQQYRARDSVWDEHAGILDAVMRGDADAAERAARHHADSAAANLVIHRCGSRSAQEAGRSQQSIRRKAP